MMGLSIGVYEILGSRDVWYFLHHQHHRPPQSSHRNDESLISGTISLGVRWAPTSSLRPFWRSGRVTHATVHNVLIVKYNDSVSFITQYSLQLCLTLQCKNEA